VTVPGRLGTVCDCTWEAGPEEQDSKYQQERGPGSGVRDGEMKWIHTRPADRIWFVKPIFLKFAMYFLAEVTFGIFYQKSSNLIIEKSGSAKTFSLKIPLFAFGVINLKTEFSS
jgi:hypothetical protein